MAPVYPVSVIECACRALEAIAAIVPQIDTLDRAAKAKLDEAGMCAIRIVRDGLLSHEALVTEGRSR